MNTFKIDGRRNFNVAELNNGGTVEASKYHGMYSVKVINSDRLVVAELASLVSKAEAEAIGLIWIIGQPSAYLVTWLVDVLYHAYHKGVNVLLFVS